MAFLDGSIFYIIGYLNNMEYNTCQICGATDGRAGLLIGNSTQGLVNACQNCHDTRTTGKLTIHSNLVCTEEELQKTMDLLSAKV